MIELVIVIVFLVLSLLFLDPFMLWMPGSALYVLVGGLLVVFLVFAGLIWRERGRDEREEMHKMTAGRAGYLVGVGVLVAGVIVGTLRSHPDPWLVAGLVAMVATKLVALLYSRFKR